jgi:hypothetical protein
LLIFHDIPKAMIQPPGLQCFPKNRLPYTDIHVTEIFNRENAQSVIKKSVTSYFPVARQDQCPLQTGFHGARSALPS